MKFLEARSTKRDRRLVEDKMLDGPSEDKGAHDAGDEREHPAPSSDQATDQSPELSTERSTECEITPAARELAGSLRVDLSRVIGTGTDGRVTVGDVRKAAEASPEASPS